MRKRRSVLELDELTLVFETLATGDTVKVKAMRKELERSRYGKRGSLAGKRGRAFLLAQMKRVRAIDVSLNRAGLIRGLVAFGFDCARLAFDETIALVLGEMEHPSGMVRMAARQLASYLRLEISFSRGDKGTREAAYEEFVRAIGALLVQHRGTVTEHHIEKIKPSVYRSLAILWHDANFRGPDDTWVPPEESAAYNPPIREYEDPWWADANEIDEIEIEDEMWRKYRGGDPDSALSALEQLERASKARLDAELERMGFAKRDADAVAASLGALGNDFGPAALTRLLDQAIASHRVQTLEQFSGVARALQGYSNHRVQSNQNGEPISDALVNAMISREECGRRKPEDFAAFARTVTEAHEAIDAFVAGRREARQQACVELAAWLEEHKIPKSAETISDRTWEQYERRLMREAQSIVHHALDWFCQAEPWSAYRHAPQRLAAIAWHVVKRINEDERRDPVFLSDVSNADLSAFGGWASPGAVNDPGLFATSIVRANTLDPDLLLLTEREPDG